MDQVQRPIRHANEFWDYYRAQVFTEPKAGDLVFFSRRGVFPTHVGIMRDESSYIHAPGTTDSEVTIEPLISEPISVSTTMGRVLFRTNPIGFKAPSIPSAAPTYRQHQQLAD